MKGLLSHLPSSSSIELFFPLRPPWRTRDTNRITSDVSGKRCVLIVNLNVANRVIKIIVVHLFAGVDDEVKTKQRAYSCYRGSLWSVTAKVGTVCHHSTEQGLFCFSLPRFILCGTTKTHLTQFSNTHHCNFTLLIRRLCLVRSSGFC